MVHTVISNKYKKSVTLHFVANATVTIVGNNTVSNVAQQDEIILGATIQQVWHGCPDGAHWVVTRGNSTVNSIVAVFNSSDYIDYAGAGAAHNVAATGQNLYVTLNGGVNGYIMIDLKKIGNNNFNKV